MRSIGNYIYVRHKWGETEYKGKLVSTDSYMNIQLSDAEEHIPDQEATKLGQILIR
jgi:small nuclear ribonucleoprotein F